MTTEAVEESESIDGTGPIRPLERYKRRRTEEIVAAIYEDAERLKRREVEKAVGNLEAHGDLGDVQRDAVEGMADAIVDQLLATPTRGIRQATEWSTLHAALRLFDPEFETRDGTPHGGDPGRSGVNDDD